MRIIIVMSLWDLPPFKKAIVSQISSSIPVEYATRLRELGFSEGEEVLCLKHTPFGSPRIYKVADSIFSMARDVAETVMVDTL